MLKIILIIVGIVIVFVAIYYGRFLFTKKVVEEAIPEAMKTNIKTTKQGTFRDIDFIHKGSGSALLLEDESGKRLLRFEDFKVTNGPDLYVYLTKNPEPTSDKSSLGDFINLGRLKGSVGSQNYEINQDITGYNTVVIWCQRFSALFSFSLLQ